MIIENRPRHPPNDDDDADDDADDDQVDVDDHLDKSGSSCPPGGRTRGEGALRINQLLCCRHLQVLMEICINAKKIMMIYMEIYKPDCHGHKRLQPLEVVTLEATLLYPEQSKCCQA